MALFDGFDIFGLTETCNTGDHPRDTQTNSFNGLNGVEELDGGSRGLTTRITGVLFGAGLDGLSAARGIFRSYKDGNTYVLTDTHGDEWQNVKLHVFSPSERIQQAADGTCFQTYSAEFKHLSG